MKNQDQQYQAPDGGRTFTTADEIAKTYSVDPSTVFKWAAKRRIPSEEFEGTRRFHLPSVRQKLEGIYRISDDDFELGVF